MLKFRKNQDAQVVELPDRWAVKPPHAVAWGYCASWASWPLALNQSGRSRIRTP